MITLTSTLQAAQRAGGRGVLYKIVLEKTGFTTLTYTYTRITDILHHEIDGWFRDVIVILDDSDGVLRPIDLKGYQATIGYGYNTSAGDEYVGWIFTVIDQKFTTQQGSMVCTLYCAGLGNQIDKDIASQDYFPADDAADTVKDYIDAIKGTSLTCFSHTTAFTVDWDVEDWLIDSFAPKDAFKIYKGQSKLAKIKELLSYTNCDGKVDSDNHVSIFMTGSPAWQANFAYVANQIVKPTTPSDWAANTVYSLNARVKPTSQNGFWYVCTTAGTSHATTEPTWVTKDGLTITDGTVTWTCRDSNYIYTCTTAGTSGGTQPVWPYTADATIADNTAVWTLKYAYQYAQTSTGHNFFSKEVRNRIIIPNKITVKSRPSDTGTAYTGNATEPASYARLPKDDFVYARVTSNQECTDIATAIIDRLAREAETGSGYVMINVGQECQDWVLITDAWMSDAVRGRIKSITRHVGNSRFDMWISFSSRIAQFPMGLAPAMMQTSEQTGQPIPDWAIQLQDFMYKNDNLLLDEINKMRLEVERVIMEGVLTRPICIKVMAEDTALTTGDGKAYFTVPPELHGRNLVEAYAVIYTVSTDTNLTTVQIANATDSVDMLSTKITIDVSEYNSLTAATPPVIDTTKDDVVQGDRLRIDVDVAASGAAGLDIYLVFALPRS